MSAIARFLLDTNILSDLVRQPQGRVTQHIAAVGEDRVCTSIVVAAELRFGTAKRAAPRLTQQVEAILGALCVLALEPPVMLFTPKSVPPWSVLAHPSVLMIY